MPKLPYDKVAFVLSTAVLAWLYGFATSTRQWFPNDRLVRAWNQAEALSRSRLPATSTTRSTTGTR